jgi:hypothetical protein
LLAIHCSQTRFIQDASKRLSETLEVTHDAKGRRKISPPPNLFRRISHNGMMHIAESALRLSEQTARQFIPDGFV